PDGNIWDAHKQTKIKVAAFKRLVGKKLGQEWLDAEGKRQIADEDIQSAVRAARKRGVPGIDRALERFVYLEPSRTVWD
ncbi:hypothetical protein Q4595_30205, partial [Wenyingzhuangia sp. 1_MG-2023]|nr:hypothetical protein [Wenyingzhuangia sp. 1_MG-2023]